MTDTEVRAIVARYFGVQFSSLDDLEQLLVAAKSDLVNAGATKADVTRAASHISTAVLDNTGLPTRVRGEILPTFEKLFGKDVPLRARVAADLAAAQTMKEAGLSEAETDAALTRGHQGVEGFPIRLLLSTVAAVFAWQYSVAVAVLVFLVPLWWPILKAMFRGAKKGLSERSSTGDDTDGVVDKSTKYDQALMKVAVNLWEAGTEETKPGHAPLVFRFERPDSRLRYMAFCLATAYFFTAEEDTLATVSIPRQSRGL